MSRQLAILEAGGTPGDPETSPGVAAVVRRPIRPTAKPRHEPTPVAIVPSPPRPIPRRTVTLVVAGLLIAHYALAASSLLRENPTVDEVNHLPAGVSYWETGSFRLYHHNPPLIKLVAALPVVLSGGRIKVYPANDWVADAVISPVLFGHLFALRNADRYFELFTLARLVMPVFSVLGGLVVFAWSRRLFGDRGGLLSLALWCVCPNILAHARLITSDVGATSLGLAATYAFWRYLHQPTWRRAGLAGLILGLALLSKFSLLLLYPLWPILWVVFEVAKSGLRPPIRTLYRAAGQGALIVAASVLTINLGYGFEGTGRPLGSFRFASGGLLTRPGKTEPKLTNELFDAAWRHRVNRFRGSWIGRLPAPLPSHYLLGFDAQKLEADGVPRIWFDPRATDPNEMLGYTVYLDGVLRTSGWRSYYALALLYKTPEGTLAILALAAAAFALSKRARVGWGDEAVILVVPMTFFLAMTFLTDINLGLRYVLPLFPYLFVFAGRLAPWADGAKRGLRRVAWSIVLALLALATASTLAIHPHYLAHMNWLSGGPDRDPPRLIDSNLDWGQDLVGLRDWLRAHPGEGPVGLVYFGQIPPNIFALRGDGFPWFLPPPRPGRVEPMTRDTSVLAGFTPRLTPGLYAVSASIRQGLSWRIYDPSSIWAATWRANNGAYDYFRSLTPFHRIGHSILLFRVTEAQAARLNARLGLP